MSAPYQPSRTLRAKLARRVVPLRARRRVEVGFDTPVVSLTFDDAPASIAEHALPLMEERGWRATIYAATGLFGAINHHGRMLTAAELRRLQARGHEIGAHSHAHVDYGAMDVADVLADLGRARKVFTENGLGSPESFAWPYGEASARAKLRLGGEFGSLRGTGHVVHTTQVDLNQVGSWRLFSGGPMDLVFAALDRLEAEGGWMTLFTHDVRPSPTAWGCTPMDFERVIERVARMGARVLTVGSAVRELTQARPTDAEVTTVQPVSGDEGVGHVG